MKAKDIGLEPIEKPKILFSRSVILQTVGLAPPMS
jgi:hypothetical protein